MCALGLYLAFLLLEDMISGNYSTNTTQNYKVPLKTTFNSYAKYINIRRNITKRGVGKQDVQIYITTTSQKPNKKWQLGKVTQKQYEIINMIRRKTKIFVDESFIYTTNKRSRTLRSSTSRPNTFRSSTFRPNTFRSSTFRSNTLRSSTFRSKTLRLNTLQSITPRPNTLQSNTLTSSDFRSKALRSSTLLSSIFRPNTSRLSTLRSIALQTNTVRTSALQTNIAKVPALKREFSPISLSTTSLPLRTTTFSDIEFYYMDNLDETKRNCSKFNCKFYRSVEETSSLPFLIFHLKGPYVDPIPVQGVNWSNYSGIRNNQVRVSAIRLKEVQPRSKVADTPFLHMKMFPKTTVAYVQVSKDLNALISTTKEIKNETKLAKTVRPLQPSSSKEYFIDSNTLMKRAILPPPSLNSLGHDIVSNCNTYTTKSTTIYDKIKFFEIYDQFTRKQVPRTKKNINATKENFIENNEKILLEHVDHASHEHGRSKHAKKHITENFINGIFSNDAVSKSQALLTNDTQKVKLDGKSYYMDENTKSEPNNTNTGFSYMNGTARWSDYPFAAVYIYEPSQVHCDAVAINTHWLVASGSCLSRVRGKVNDPFRLYDEGQSAFVAYCGELWWEPERVAYVKYTVVHPKYHPRDKVRQHLYNIGAIQVVSSMMSSCSGWAAVSLMSHQFAAKSETPWATAVGWGLDRFDTRYGSTDLPKTPLMVYKCAVYSDSCPGNVGYSKAKRLDEGGGLRNVQCLSLPPYYGEDTDPVHGGLLLANGKLIALYLQEERRAWGEQCAQYTSVWRLIPWLMDVAREPEEIDTIIFDI